MFQFSSHTSSSAGSSNSIPNSVLGSFLQNELTTLISESKRKNPEVKEVSCWLSMICMSLNQHIFYTPPPTTGFRKTTGHSKEPKGKSICPNFGTDSKYWFRGFGWLIISSYSLNIYTHFKHSLSELAKTEDGLKPFLLACESKNSKLIPIAIGCIQKLINHQAIPEVLYINAYCYIGLLLTVI